MVIMVELGRVFADPCKQYELDCDPMKGVPNSYNCSAPSPVHGDSCIAIDAPTGDCSGIVGLSVTEGVVANWTGSKITITVNLEARCIHIIYSVIFVRILPVNK